MSETTILWTIKLELNDRRGLKVDLDRSPEELDQLLEEDEYWLGYKVVDEDRQSLGLNGNDNIMTYSESSWVEADPTAEGDPNRVDKGGIYACRTPGKARRLRQYVREKHGINGQIYETQMKGLTSFNDRSLTSKKIWLLEKETEDLNFELEPHNAQTQNSFSSTSN